eukprot:1194525-Prorocentrum_minimum.AAC.6
MVAQGQEEFKALRWAVNITTWDPTDKEWDFLLGLLPESERDPVLRYAHRLLSVGCLLDVVMRSPCHLTVFKFMDDKKRAIVSRLLQRRCVEENMGISWEDINIKRTKGRKPFLANEVRNSIAHSAGDIRAFLPPAVQAFGSRRI